MSNRIVVTAEDVRAWAKGKGLDVAEFGRLPQEVIDAFNKGRKNTYVSTMRQPARVIKVAGHKADSAGRNRPRNYEVTLPELRTWARSNGFAVGLRGRIPAEVVEAYGQREARVSA